MFNSQIPLELQPEAQAINRQQQMAQLLLQKGLTPTQGQTVAGGVYVPPNPMEYLAKLYSTYAGTKANEALDAKELALAQKLRELGAKETQDILQTAQGTPEKVTELAGPAYQGVAPTATMPAKAGDANAALAQALMGQSPQAQSLVPSLMQSALPKKTDKLIEYEQYKSETPEGKRLKFTDWADRNEKARLALDEKRYGLEAARFKLEKNKQEINPAEAPLRTSFLNQAQPHIAISQAYRKVESAPTTAAGDMSRIFGYMKILDPGSTVREGEYASAENARGVPDTVRAQYNRVMSGQRLTDKQRQEFVQAAGDLVNSQKQQFGEVAKYYTDISSRNRINPENVIYDPYKDLNIKTTPAKQEKVVNPNQQLNIPATNSGNWNIISVTPSR